MKKLHLHHFYVDGAELFSRTQRMRGKRNHKFHAFDPWATWKNEPLAHLDPWLIWTPELLGTMNLCTIGPPNPLIDLNPCIIGPLHTTRVSRGQSVQGFIVPSKKLRGPSGSEVQMCWIRSTIKLSLAKKVLFCRLVFIKPWIALWYSIGFATAKHRSTAKTTVVKIEDTIAMDWSW